MVTRYLKDWCDRLHAIIAKWLSIIEDTQHSGHSWKIELIGYNNRYTEWEKNKNLRIFLGLWEEKLTAWYSSLLRWEDLVMGQTQELLFIFFGKVNLDVCTRPPSKVGYKWRTLQL